LETKPKAPSRVAGQAPSMGSGSRRARRLPASARDNIPLRRLGTVRLGPGGLLTLRAAVVRDIGAGPSMAARTLGSAPIGGAANANRRGIWLAHAGHESWSINIFRAAVARAAMSAARSISRMVSRQGICASNVIVLRPSRPALRGLRPDATAPPAIALCR
jgi:hypothetical protein